MRPFRRSGAAVHALRSGASPWTSVPGRGPEWPLRALAPSQGSSLTRPNVIAAFAITMPSAT